MKKASDILKLLQNQPQLSKLSSFACIKKIQSALNKPLQKMVKFAYIKNNTLFFVLNHPGAKQEFDNNIQSIKSALNMVKPQECAHMQIKDIKAFVSHTPNATVSLVEPKPPQRYKERSSGSFEIQVIKNPQLRNIAQTIQTIIKAQNDT